MGIFNKVMSAIFRDKGGAFYNLMHPDYGAVGDGVADDTDAIVACYASVPAGGTMVIPSNYAFRYTRKLSWNRRVNVIGYGTDSVLVPDLGSSSTDSIVVNDTVSSLLYAVRIDNFAIVSNATNCCRNGIVFNRVNISEVNLHIQCGATQYGALVNGCLITRFRFVVSTNFVYSRTGGLPAIGAVKVVSDLVNSISNNNNVIVCGIEGGVAGLHIEETYGAGGNNDVSGCIEGCSGVGLYATGCSALSVHDMHLEANGGGSLTLDSCTQASVGPNVLIAPGSSAGTLALTGCTGTKIDGVLLDSLTIDSACRRTRIGSLTYNVAGGTITDASTTTMYLGPINNAGTATSQALPDGSFVDGSPLITNGTFERWPSGGAAAPADWSFVGGLPTWVRTGVGMGDTRTHYSRFAAKITTPAVNQGPAISFDYTRSKGRVIVLPQWVYVVTGQPNVTVSVYYDGGAGVVTFGNVTAKDTWVLVQISLYVDPTRSGAQLVFLTTGGTGTFYLADVCPRVGHVAGFAPPLNAHEYIYVGGVKISGGNGSPNSAVVGSPGDLWLRNDGGTGTSQYTKETGTNTNTGWVAK